METGLLRLQSWEDCRDLSTFVQDLKKATELRKRLQEFNFQYLRDKLYTLDEVFGMEGICWFTPSYYSIPYNIFGLDLLERKVEELPYDVLLSIECLNDFDIFGLDLQERNVKGLPYKVLLPIVCLIDLSSGLQLFSERIDNEITLKELETYLYPETLKSKIKELTGYHSKILIDYYYIELVIKIRHRLSRSLFYNKIKKETLLKFGNLISGINQNLLIKRGENWHWKASEFSEEAEEDIKRDQYYQFYKHRGERVLVWIDQYRCPWYIGTEENLRNNLRIKVSRKSGTIDYLFHSLLYYVDSTRIGSRRLDNEYSLTENEINPHFNNGCLNILSGIKKGLRVSIDTNEIIGQIEEKG